MAFRFTLGDESWSTDYLSADETCAIEEALGIEYFLLRPLHNMKHRRMILATFLERTRPPDEVAKIVGALTLRQMEDLITWEEADIPVEFEDGIPLDEAAPTPGSTDTSSCAPGPTTGLPTLPAASQSET